MAPTVTLSISGNNMRLNANRNSNNLPLVDEGSLSPSSSSASLSSEQSDWSNHSRDSGTDSATVKPILRSSSAVFAVGSSQPKLKRISFSGESLFKLYSTTDSPQAVAKEPLFAQSISHSIPEAESPEDLSSASFFLGADSPSESPPAQISWSIVSATTPTATDPISSQLLHNPVAFESIRIIYPTDSDSCKLLLTVLVENRHFEKNVAAVYTIDKWKNVKTSSQASYVSSIYSSSIIASDRFSIELECNLYEINFTNPESIITLEFAIKCVMGGVESWDNRNGSNHRVVLKRVFGNLSSRNRISRLPSKQSKSALDVESEELTKRRASVVALKVGAAIADEVKRINKEFSEQQRKISLDRMSSSSSVSSGTTAVVFALEAPPGPASIEESPLFLTVDTANRAIRSNEIPISSITLLSESPIERVSELSDVEAAYASKIASPISPLTTKIPFKRSGNFQSLTLVDSPLEYKRPDGTMFSQICDQETTNNMPLQTDIRSFDAESTPVPHKRSGLLAHQNSANGSGSRTTRLVKKSDRSSSADDKKGGFGEGNSYSALSKPLYASDDAILWD